MGLKVLLEAAIAVTLHDTTWAGEYDLRSST